MMQERSTAPAEDRDPTETHIAAAHGLAQAIWEYAAIGALLEHESDALADARRRRHDPRASFRAQCEAIHDVVARKDAFWELVNRSIAAFKDLEAKLARATRGPLPRVFAECGQPIARGPCRGSSAHELVLEVAAFLVGEKEIPSWLEELDLSGRLALEAARVRRRERHGDAADGNAPERPDASDDKWRAYESLLRDDEDILARMVSRGEVPKETALSWLRKEHEKTRLGVRPLDKSGKLICAVNRVATLTRRAEAKARATRGRRSACNR